MPSITDIQPSYLFAEPTNCLSVFELYKKKKKEKKNTPNPPQKNEIPAAEEMRDHKA